METPFYIRIRGVWYDFTGYNQHPGGLEVFRQYTRKDATAKFESIGFHLGRYVQEQLDNYRIRSESVVRELEAGLTA